MSGPLARVANTNPFATFVDEASAVALIGMQTSAAAGPWDWQSVTDVKPAPAAITVIPIPMTVPQPRLTVQGEEIAFSDPVVGSYTLAPAQYTDGLSVDQIAYDNYGPISGVVDALTSSLANVGNKHICRLAVNELFALGSETRVGYDNLTFFNTAHPVDPMDPSRKSLTINSATWANYFVSTPFTKANFIKAVMYALMIPLEDGENMPIKKITLAVPAPMVVYAWEYVRTTFGGINYAPQGENIVGSDGNVIETFAKNQGIEFEVLPLSNYPVTLTNGAMTPNSYAWYVYTNVTPLFNLRYQKLHTYVEQVSDTDYEMFIRQRRLHSVRAQLVVGGPILPQAVIKFINGAS